MKIAGIVILILGILLTVFTAVQFFTREKVADLGLIEITKQNPHNISWSPILGIAVMVIGGLILWKYSKN